MYSRDKFLTVSKLLESSGDSDRVIAAQAGVSRQFVTRVRLGEVGKSYAKVNRDERVTDYDQIYRDAIAAMEQKLARKREALA